MLMSYLIIYYLNSELLYFQIKKLAKIEEMPAESSPNNFSAVIPSAESGKNQPAIEVSPKIEIAKEIYDKLDHAFGIAIESGGNVAPEFETQPEAILKLQTFVRKIKLNADREEYSFQFDELICETANCIQLRKDGDEKMETNFKEPESLGQIYGIPQFDSCNGKMAATFFDYLLGLYGRCNSLASQNRIGLPATIFSCLFERARVQFILFLRGLLCSNINHQDVSIVFAKFLLTNAAVSNTFVHDLVLCCRNSNLTDSDALVEVFGPILDILRNCASHNAATKRFDFYAEIPYDLLAMLLDIKIGENNRPIADLIVSRPNFHPREFTTKKHRGREFVHVSFLGPFFALSVAGNQSSQYESNFEDAEIAFSEADTDGALKDAKISEYQTLLAKFRIKMHSIFHALFVNASTRKATLDYISEAFEQNRKLAQMQAEYEQLANCTAMLNQFSVLLDLSEKVMDSKVQNDYIFHPECRLATMREETGLKMDKAELESYRSKLDHSYTATFNTECFFLTLAYMGISLNRMVTNHRQTKRLLFDIERQVRDAEARMNRIKENRPDAHDTHQLQRTRMALQRAGELLKKFSLSSMAYECLLYDDALLTKCTKFVNKLLRILLRNIIPIPSSGLDTQSFQRCLERFTSFPETFLENGVDFLQFLLGGSGRRFKILLQNISDYPQLILHLVISLGNIKNPFLASKIVDLLFYICPDVHHEARDFYRLIMLDPQAVQHLFPALVKFYADVETTGSHTEFYDKFNIRRNIQIIFQNMWNDLAHRDRMIKFAGENSPDFYRFLNMVINDTTFLLDESLEKLKRIHEIEAQMANEMQWAALDEEERKQQLESLVDAKRQVKIWLQLGGETMGLFVTLTGDAPQIFRQAALGERVAAMLNHNLVQLCGPKCSALKVNDAQLRFNWDPRRLTELIVKVYVNLASEQFGRQIAQDERSYKTEYFDQALGKLKNIIPINLFESFKHLAEQAKKAYEAKTNFEEKFEDDCPDEFRCAIMFTMMQDPVTLPSGQVVEKKNILRHLLSDPHNPFNRQPMTEADLQPNAELKARIKDWVQQMKADKKKATME